MSSVAGCLQGISTASRRVRMMTHSLGALALIGVLATGCGGESAPAAPENEVTHVAQEPTAGSVGPAQQGDGVEVSIDAIRTTDASGMVDMDPSTAEIDTEPLQAGQEFLVLDVTITNTGAVPHEYNALSWSAEDPGSGETYQAALLAVTGYDLIAGDLGTRGSHRWRRRHRHPGGRHPVARLVRHPTVQPGNPVGLGRGGSVVADSAETAGR